MKVVYVAGPFRGPTHWAIAQNIRAAEALALEVWKLGNVAVIYPHANTAHFTGELQDRAFLEADLEILRRCDAVIFTPDWERSEGAIDEREEAIVHNIPIFHEVADLKYWL